MFFGTSKSEKLDRSDLYGAVEKAVLQYGFLSRGKRTEPYFAKTIQSGWISFDLRIVERFERIEVGFHYYNNDLHEINKHSLVCEVKGRAKWFIAANPLSLPEISNIWNLRIDRSKPAVWHASKLLANFSKAAPLFEKLCDDHAGLLQHLGSNTPLAYMMLSLPNSRICAAISLAIYLHRTGEIPKIFAIYRETLTDAEGKAAILEQATVFLKKLSLKYDIDKEIVQACE